VRLADPLPFPRPARQCPVIRFLIDRVLVSRQKAHKQEGTVGGCPLKTVERVLPIHEAQLLTYLRLAQIHTGLLMNFNVPVLRDGIKRMVL